MVKLQRVAGQRHQHARYLGVQQRFHVAALELHILVRLAHDDAEAGLAGGLLDALDNRRKKLALDVGHHHAQQAALAFAQGRGQVVGLVIELFGQLQHPLFGSCPNAVVVAQGPRYGRHRYT